MQRKYLIVSHGKLATGLQSSLDILADKGHVFQTIDAYVTDEDYTSQITTFIESVGEEEQGIIFTDLYGGSVNQKVVAETMHAKKENIFIISNTNLAVILTILFSSEPYLTADMIQNMIEESQVVFVPTKVTEDEEDVFF
ncbi:PTS sugar transporter subunit IIA [Candidatus Enterococcus willemsii]|uniref:PTS mannnose transporter subunit IIA n=1 Tax=Candidatus Enterococcus willemsii TaxID=1857215 RepID=A0ABQ6YZY0_9ENTE|nr:PTS sugar transporter subunit IIA [Enterococcus sp. CU12B]KAF1304176.1 PTS mannnose transporter subunit IIA [Enterococcus sp. CU12B]